MNRDYHTDDVNTAAFLLALGYQFTGLRTNAQPGHFFFGFADPDGHTQEATLAFFNDRPVPAKLFVDACRHLVGLTKRSKVESTNYGKRFT